MSKPRKPYRPPAVKTETISPPAVLLLCTGQYNCNAEVGYDCCQPSPATCFDNC